jgi:methyl-accepting chemotaxis protein
MPIWLALLGMLIVMGATAMVVHRRITGAVPAGGAGDATVAELTDMLRLRDAEVEELRAELEAQAQNAQAQQRELNQRLRRRAREAIDDTADVIGGKLQDVVAQMNSAREAAAATNERVVITSDAANALVRRAHSAEEAATALNTSLRQVAGIASVISGIASQTRLLALNATIEAVRAGASGSGFAVVADEVKSLATMTSTSTGQIDQTVASIQSDSQAAADVVAGIAGAVDAIEEITREIASATTDQRATVDELSRQLDMAMTRIRDLVVDNALHGGLRYGSGRAEDGPPGDGETPD